MPKAAIENDPVATANQLRDAVHIVTQKKGGVGKSTVARVLAEYLKETHGLCQCFDTDPSQPTFGRVDALNVKRVQILKGDEIDPMLINPMLEQIINENGPFVIDTGSSSYHPLWSYIVGAELFDLLATHARPVILHVPLAPKPDLEDTITGFSEIAQHAPPHSVVVWLNQREHAIEIPGGADFTDLDVARKNITKLLGVVISTRQKYRWNRQYVGEMIEKRQTFAEAIAEQSALTRSYLTAVRKEIFDQLQGVGL